MKKALLTICLVLVAFPVALPSGAEEPQAGAQDLQGLFFDTTNVNVINVEVFVTDKKGRRVTDLRQENFEVYENGRLMEITNFYAFENGRPTAQSNGDRVGAPARTAAVARYEPPPLPEEQRLHLIIYFDNYNIRPANRNRVIHRLRRFLREKLDPQDRVMVVSYDRSLHVRQPFTSDRTRIADALTQLEELSGTAVTRDADRRLALQNIEDSSDGFEATIWAKSYADQVFTETEFTLRALSDQISALSGLVGRKALLYVSDGIPMIAGEDVFMAVDEMFERTSARLDAYAYDYSSRYRELVAKANASGTTFYTMDAGGLQAHSSISAEYGGTRQGGGLAFIDSIRSGNLQAPLHLLADDTGGVAIVNTNAIEAGLERIAEDFDNYYSLGYHAPHHGDGRYYKIEVKVVGRKGLRVRHRNGYRDNTPEARLTDGSISALYFGFERNPIDAELEFGDPLRQDGGHFLLPMTIKVPIGKLTLAPVDGSHVARVKISVVVMDEEGRVSPVQQQDPLTMAIPAEDLERARGQHISYDLELAMRKGVSRIAVGIRDELASDTSFLRDTINIAAR